MSGPVGYSPGRDPDLPHASRAAPMAESICWRPIEGEATGPGAQQYPIYVRQRALAALHDHFRGSITQGILGFLVGALLEDPTTRERWLELEFIVRLTQPIYGDKTALVISRVWERLQQEVGRTGGHMLGWYHSHPPLGVEIAPGDIEAHEQYFGRPWQIALLLGQTPKGPAGAFYRPSAGLPLGTTPLPFFEIVARDSITAEGRKRTRVTWKNYRPDLRRTSGMVTGVSAVLQALQTPMRPSEATPASTGGAPLAARRAEPPAAVAASAESALPVAATAEPVAVATGAPRLDGRVNTPPRGSGAIKVAATTAPRTAEPPLPPSLRISGAVEKTPEPVSFTPPSAATPALPVAEATSVPLAEPVTALRSADVLPSEPPPALLDKPSPPMYGSPAARGEAPAPEATPPPVRPRPRNPAIDGLPIIEPPPRPSAAVSAPAARPEDAPARSATAAPSAEAAKAPAVPAAVAARELVPETPRRAGAPEPAPAAAPSPAGPRRPGAEGPRPSVQAGGVEILRALPAAQTPTERPAVGAAPLSRPSRDRPTSEVLQELADAITRAARTSGSSPALDVSPPARPGRTTAPRHGPPEVTRGGGAGPRTPVAGSAAVRAARPGVEEPARREPGPVTFTPSPEAAIAPPGLGPPRQPAGVTFTPAPGAGATIGVPESPLAAAFAPKAPAESAEPEMLPDSLRGGRPAIEPPSVLRGPASSELSVDAARPSSAAAAAPRASGLSVRRSFGSGLQAGQEDSGALARLPYVLALFAALAAAVWWFAIRPRMGADIRIEGPSPAAAVAEPIPSAPAAVPTESLPVAAPVAPPVADSSQTVPVVVAPDAWTPLDQLVDSLDAAIFRYLDRASAFDEGQRDCQLLSAALVSVDRFWVAYNAQRRRLDAPLDSLRVLRDQAAYANVEAVDTHFGGSGCPRP